MDKVKGRILLKQQISNLKEVGFEDIERTVIKYFHNRKVISRMWFIFLYVLYYLGVRLVGSTNFNYETGNKTLSN